MVDRKTILICGATGFVGRNLVAYYEQQDCNVVAVRFTRPAYAVAENVRWVQADLRDFEQVNRLVCDVDIIIQAAATTSGSKDIVNSPHIHVTDNAVMNSYLLRAAYDHSIKHFIFFSCTVMYPSLDRSVREEDYTGEIIPKYYGAGSTKVYIEQMCNFYAGLGRTKHTAIRHSNVYGPYDKYDLDRSHVFGATITKTMLAENEFSIWGAGDEKRDLLHVDDLMNFVDKAITKQKEKFGLYNCGYGVSLTIKELVAKVISASGKDLKVTHDLSQPSIPFNLVADYAKAKKDLGWEPKVSIDAGIASTIEWWLENIDPETLKTKN